MNNRQTHHIGDDDFAARISSARPTLVQFTAAWCPPCQPMHTVVEQLGNERGDINVAFLDVEESPRVTAQYFVRAMPTFILFKDGAVLAQRVGAAPKAAIADWVATALART